MAENLDDKAPWTTVSIGIPPELKGYEADFKRAWDGMVFKMRRNVVKGKWENVPLDVALSGLDGEVAELKEAVVNGNVMEITLEAADVANMALIVAAIGLEKAGV